MWRIILGSILIISVNLQAQLRITEVFGNRYGPLSDVGHVWVELYNAGKVAVPLSGLTMTRLDGRAKTEGFRIRIPDTTADVPPQGYAVIGQSPDLGTGMCLTFPVVVIEDPTFAFKHTGLQSLCIALADSSECQVINGSGAFPDGHSRIRLMEASEFTDKWGTEDCALLEHTYASPGQPNGVCHMEGHSAQDVLQVCSPKPLVIAPPAEHPKIEEVPFQVEITQSFTPPSIQHFTILAMDKNSLHIGLEVDMPDAHMPFSIAIFARMEDPRVHWALPGEDGGRHGKSVQIALSALPPGSKQLQVHVCDPLGHCSVAVADTPVVAPASGENIPRLSLTQATLTRKSSHDVLMAQYVVTPDQEGHIMLILVDTKTQEREVIAAGLSSHIKDVHRIMLEKRLARCHNCLLEAEMVLRNGEHVKASAVLL